MKTLMALFFAVFVMGTSIAEAAVVRDVNVSGQLLGAQYVEVEVGGLPKLFNVSFEDGMCVVLFDGCNEPSDFIFAGASGTGPDNPAIALVTQVFLDVPGTVPGTGLFDTDPELTRGCEDITQCFAMTPTGNLAGLPQFAQIAGATNGAPGFADGRSGFSQSITLDSASQANRTFAVWTPSAVPAPSAMLLMGTGLFGLIGWRWWSTKLY